MLYIRWARQYSSSLSSLAPASNMMSIKIYNIVLLLAFALCSDGSLKKYMSPPHCTHLSKDTDYVSRFKLDYPAAYLIPGQREAHQRLFCVRPAAVNKAVTVVCDWVAPPQVSFTLGDDYLSVVRVDPSGRFYGNAVITTYQLCNHSNISTSDDVFVTKLI